MDLLPYQEFFYRFDDLPENASPTAIRRRCPPGSRRKDAFEYFHTQLHPNDVRYLHGYVAAYYENGVYDDEQFADCFRLIETGLALPDRGTSHKKLRSLRARLEGDQRSLADIDTDEGSPSEKFRMRRLFAAKQFDTLHAEFDSLRKSLAPLGILGPPEERHYWQLYQFILKCVLVQADVDTFIQRMNTYEQERLAVKLHPRPSLDLQEAIIGYFCQHDFALAVARIDFWVSNSRMPHISDAICHHPLFKEMLAHLEIRPE